MCSAARTGGHAVAKTASMVRPGRTRGHSFIAGSRIILRRRMAGWIGPVVQLLGRKAARLVQRQAAMLGCVAGVQDLEGRRGSGWACAAFCRGFPCATPGMGIFDIDSHGWLVWLTTARYDQFLRRALARRCRHISRKDIAMRLFRGPCTIEMGTKRRLVGVLGLASFAALGVMLSGQAPQPAEPAAKAPDRKSV